MNEMVEPDYLLFSDHRFYGRRRHGNYCRACQGQVSSNWSKRRPYHENLECVCVWPISTTFFDFLSFPGRVWTGCASDWWSWRSGAQSCPQIRRTQRHCCRVGRESRRWVTWIMITKSIIQIPRKSLQFALCEWMADFWVLFAAFHSIQFEWHTVVETSLRFGETRDPRPKPVFPCFFGSFSSPQNLGHAIEVLNFTKENFLNTGQCRWKGNPPSLLHYSHSTTKVTSCFLKKIT